MTLVGLIIKNIQAQYFINILGLNVFLFLDINFFTIYNPMPHIATDYTQDNTSHNITWIVDI